MRETRPGDVVVYFANVRIGHFGIVSGLPISAPKPGEFGAAGQNWSDDGWYVPISWTPLADSNHAFNIAPSLLNRDFRTDQPNRKWAGDISYVWTREGRLYLAVILDLHSRRVIGWALSNRMKRDLAIRALKMAIALRQPPKGCIHHSDRGRRTETPSWPSSNTSMASTIRVAGTQHWVGKSPVAFEREVA